MEDTIGGYLLDHIGGLLRTMPASTGDDGNWDDGLVRGLGELYDWIADVKPRSIGEVAPWLVRRVSELSELEDGYADDMGELHAYAMCLEWAYDYMKTMR